MQAEGGERENKAKHRVGELNSNVKQVGSKEKNKENTRDVK